MKRRDFISLIGAAPFLIRQAKANSLIGQNQTLTPNKEYCLIKYNKQTIGASYLIINGNRCSGSMMLYYDEVIPAFVCGKIMPSTQKMPFDIIWRNKDKILKNAWLMESGVQSKLGDFIHINNVKFEFETIA